MNERVIVPALKYKKKLNKNYCDTFHYKLSIVRMVQIIKYKCFLKKKRISKQPSKKAFLGDSALK